MSNAKLSPRQITFWETINQSLVSRRVKRLIELYKADTKNSLSDENSIELKYVLASKILEIVKKSLDQELEGGLNDH